MVAGRFTAERSNSAATVFERLASPDDIHHKLKKKKRYLSSLSQSAHERLCLQFLLPLEQFLGKKNVSAEQISKTPFVLVGR